MEVIVKYSRLWKYLFALFSALWVVLTLLFLGSSGVANRFDESMNFLIGNNIDVNDLPESLPNLVYADALFLKDYYPDTHGIEAFKRYISETEKAGLFVFWLLLATSCLVLLSLLACFFAFWFRRLDHR